MAMGAPMVHPFCLDRVGSWGLIDFGLHPDRACSQSHLQNMGNIVMAVDLKSLKKLEALPPAAMAGAPGDDDRFMVLVKLREGAKQPAYILSRAKMGAKIFTGEILAKDLMRIDSDPDIVSVSLSRPLPLIDAK